MAEVAALYGPEPICVTAPIIGYMCPSITKYFQDNLPDPSSLEVMEIMRIYKGGSKIKGWSIEVKFRTKNKFGIMSINIYKFIVFKGNVRYVEKIKF